METTVVDEGISYDLTSSKDYLDFLDTKAGGKDGTMASILFASRFFRSNPDLRPSARAEKQNKAVAVTNYGGMIHATWEVSLEAIHAWGTTIHAQQDRLDGAWDFSEEEFFTHMSALERETAQDRSVAIAEDNYVGGPSETAAKAINTAVANLRTIRAQGHTISTKAMLQFARAMHDANKLLGELDAPTILEQSKTN